jgi:hypothetical protein
MGCLQSHQSKEKTMEKPLSADQLQHILETLKADHTNFMTIWRSNWRVDDRPAATERLARAETNARQAAERIADTRDPEQWVGTERGILRPVSPSPPL